VTLVSAFPAIREMSACRSKEDTDAFLEWQKHITAVEGEFAGFRGSEIFRPVEGVQEEWTTLYRFDSAATLDEWLTSGRRRHCYRGCCCGSRC
jgi:antibiotic biosynthesis monooxygenase (ABM) superfamily enzyme